jgi:hypothetical protein
VGKIGCVNVCNRHKVDSVVFWAVDTKSISLSVIPTASSAPPGSATRLKRNNTVSQPAGLTLNTNKGTPVIDDEIVSLVIPKGHQNNLACL